MILIVKIVDKMLELKSNFKPASETNVSAFLQLSLDSLALIGNSINEVNLTWMINSSNSAAPKHQLQNCYLATIYQNL